MRLKSKLTLYNLKGVIFVAAKAQGAPTKEFFVGMLTRDIELSDAILDLLDNCLDGVVRQRKGIDKTSTSDYYADFFFTHFHQQRFFYHRRQLRWNTKRCGRKVCI